MSDHPKNRITDGVTLDKTVLAIAAAVSTMCIGLITWVYTTDSIMLCSVAASNLGDIYARPIITNLDVNGTTADWLGIGLYDGAAGTTKAITGFGAGDYVRVTMLAFL